MIVPPVSPRMGIQWYILLSAKLSIPRSVVSLLKGTMGHAVVGEAMALHRIAQHTMQRTGVGLRPGFSSWLGITSWPIRSFCYNDIKS